MSHVLSVSPAAFGWSLRIDDQESVLVFATGAQAESAARRIAQRLAFVGERCEVLIYLRDGSLGGRLRAVPEASGVPHAADARTALEAAALA